jgi:hypothetical protein
MGTLTAPGSDVLCDVATLEAWNVLAPTHWRLLNAEVQKRVERDCGRRASLLTWVWEKQRRGALHKHFVLGVKTARERLAADLYLKHMNALRRFYGFGFMDRGNWDPKRRRRALREVSGLHAGRYLAKYLMKRDENGDPVVSEMVRHRDVPPLVAYVARVLTKQTGVTMRALREWRFIFSTWDPVDADTLRAILSASGHEAAVIEDLLGAANAPPDPQAARDH